MASVPVVVSCDVLASTGEPDPLVGDRSSFRTHFVECADDDLSVGVFSFSAEPIPGGRPFPGTGPDGAPGLRWPTYLHAPGWSATWLAAERTEGGVTLRGRVFADFGPTTTSISGVVQQLHLIKGRWQFQETDHVPRYQAGEVQLRCDSEMLLVTLEVG